MLATNSTQVLALVSTTPRQTNPSAPAFHSAVQVPSALTAGEDMAGEAPVPGDHLRRAATFPGAAEEVVTDDTAATTTAEAIPILRRRAKTQRDTSSTWTNPLIL